VGEGVLSGDALPLIRYEQEINLMDGSGSDKLQNEGFGFVPS
jgi:hypothetical protein